MYDDNTPLPFGKYKFSRLIDVPADYLLVLFRAKSYANPEIKEYIEANIEKIRERNKLPKPQVDALRITPCRKVAYPTEKEAKWRLKNIKHAKQRAVTPQRAYECPLCGAWHLTSQEKIR